MHSHSCQENCLEAGCDAYVSKPFDATNLLGTLVDLLIRHESQSLPRVEADPLTTTESGKDLQTQLEMLCLAFLGKLPERLEKMRIALEQQSLEELHLLAHRLSGTAGSYGLDGIGSSAGAIERALDRGAAKPELENLLVDLEKEIAAAKPSESPPNESS